MDAKTSLATSDEKTLGTWQPLWGNSNSLAEVINNIDHQANEVLKRPTEQKK